MIFIIIWIACAVIGYNMGKSRKMGATSGCILGLLLGVIGLVIIACSKKAEK